MWSTNLAAKAETFVEFVKSHTPCAALPVFHTVKGTIFQKVLNSGKLEPRMCKVMKKPLLYLFWGIPAYRSGRAENQNKKLSSAPICVLIERNAVSSPFEAYPFDTGCLKFAEEEYGLEDEIDIKDYKLSGDKDGPERIASSLYQTTENYLTSSIPEAVVERLSSTLNFETLKLVELIRSPETNRVDERISTIEIQQVNEIDLLSSNILAIAAPDVISESPVFKQLLIDLSADSIPYTFKRDSNQFRTIRIEEAVSEYLRRKGFL